MDILKIEPFKGSKVDFEVSLPGSKSITNRALIISALTNSSTTLENVLFSDDTSYMLDALMKMGLGINVFKKENIVEVKKGRIPEGEFNFFVGNAGTTMRFLTSYLSLGNGNFLLDGDERMRERPIIDLVNALKDLGVDVKCKFDNGCPPVEINAKGIKGGKTTIKGKNSSQYISSILMAAPYSLNPVEIYVEDELASKPYVDMTISIMKHFGAKVENYNYSKFIVNNGEYISPSRYYIEPDASTASYFLASAAILSGKVVIKGLGKNSIQGDVYFANILEKMGCKVHFSEDFIELSSSGELGGIEIDMNKVPDLVPTLAIVALFAKTPTKIYNVYNLRIKESDRIKALKNEIIKIGGKVREFEDGLEIYPVEDYKGDVISTYNDHRIAMAFSIAGLKIEGISIENPKCVSKSFPEFFDYLKKFFV